MEVIKLNTSNNSEFIEVNYYPNKDSNALILFIPGHPGSKREFEGVIKLLLRKIKDWSFITFSFRGFDTGKAYPINRQVSDLNELLEFIVQDVSPAKIALIGTSSGAVSVTSVLSSGKFSELIAKVLYIDPADFYLRDLDKTEEMFIWSGPNAFKPDGEVTADLLAQINSDVSINVVGFTLRNYGRAGYSDNRIKDDPGLYPRLNQTMVRNFFNKIPKKNKGKYIEVNNIPHAFIRDGNVLENEKNVADLILKCLKD